MAKGAGTHARILEQALERASVVGLEGLSIGELADALAMSKSGLFAHFQSKEQLQIDVLRHAAQQFVAEVVTPAISKKRGEPRITALFENWLKWAQAARTRGGCVFVSASAEFDDREGPVRRELVELQRQWLGVLSRAGQIAMEEGHFKHDLDPQQFAFELHAILLSFHFQHRLLRNKLAPRRAKLAFRALLERSRS
jgi:AcrR family transcriptional regulator